METEHESPRRFYDLMDGVYAVYFPYYMVTDLTLFRAIPSEIKRQAKNGYKYAQESSGTAGKMRCDADAIRKSFPVEIALLEQAGAKLKDYILVRI